MEAMRSTRIVAHRLAGLLVLAAVGCSGHAVPGPGPETAPGSNKVVLCHKGKKTLQVAAPAAQAHYDHGDTPGPCG